MNLENTLYYRIGLNAVKDSECVLRETVFPTARNLGYFTLDKRWFFLRFLHSTGYELRVRVKGSKRDLTIFDDCLMRSLVSFKKQNTQVIRGVNRAVYFPEIVKWGGEQGVIEAEKVFTASSIATANLNSCSSYRLGLAYTILSNSLLNLSPDQRKSFLYNYAWYWSGGPYIQRKTGDNYDILRASRQKAAVLKSQILSEAAYVYCNRMIDKGDFSFRCYEQLLALSIQRCSLPLKVLFNHIHLTANRLGVTPFEESVLAVLSWEQF